jgi:sporulation protein YlmC with PRC-barrel domain
MPLEENLNQRLVELIGSDYEIIDGQPDIIGWTVYDVENEEIGEVDNLLFDPNSQSVRYLILDLEGNAYGIEDKKVLMPIGITEINVGAKEVILPNDIIKQLKVLPSYEKGNVNRDMEIQIRQILEPAEPSVADGNQIVDQSKFYMHEHFREDKFYGVKLPIL